MKKQSSFMGEGGDPVSTPLNRGGNSINPPKILRVRGWSYYEGDPNPEPPAPTPGKTFTQAEVDSFIAKARKAEETKRSQLLTDLEKLQQSTRLTTEERDGLAAQIEQLKNESLTTEQRLTRDLETVKKTHKTDVESLSGERDSWKNHYSTLLMENQITSAASKHDAYSVSQILAQLKPVSKVVEVLDGEGKPTGQYQVLVKFQDIDPKTKKPVTVELAPDEVIKRMRELPELYGNLFKSGVQRGLGGSRSDGSGAEPDISKMTHAEYRAYRKGQR